MKSIDEVTDLTKEQKVAIKNLEKAFKRCKDVKVYIYNDYGDLIAYDGNIVSHIDDEESEYSTYGDFTGTLINHGYDLESWGPNELFVHLMEGV